MGKNKFESDIRLGEKYRDEQTGMEGVATAVYFFQHGCERVTLERFNEVKGEINEFTFDAPRLTHVNSGKVATSDRTGGPDKSVDARRAIPSR